MSQLWWITFSFSLISLDLKDEWAFPEKKHTPLLTISIFFKLIPPCISIWIYRDPLEFSIFLHWPPGNPCYFLNFWFTPWNSDNFHSTPWIFPLISNRTILIFYPVYTYSYSELVQWPDLICNTPIKRRDKR